MLNKKGRGLVVNVFGSFITIILLIIILDYVNADFDVIAIIKQGVSLFSGAVKETLDMLKDLLG